MENNNLNEQNRKGWKKGFFTIAFGQTISLIGSSAVQFALIWWLASETSSPLMLSFASLFAFLPQLLLGPFAGVWVDRLHRKTVIICADLFIGAVATVFAFSFLIWNPPYWLVCVVLGARAVGNVFHTPAIQAAMPMLVPREELIRANGLNQFMQSGAFMLGPVIGAAMYGVFPIPVILLSDLLGAVVACLTVAVVKIPEIEREQQKHPDFIGEIKEGITIYLQDKKLCNVTLAMAICMVFFMPLGSFYPLMTSDYFKASAWHAGLNQLLYAVGMMIGAVAISSLGTIKNKLLVVRIGLLAIGIISLLCGILPQNMTGFWMFAVLCTLLGATMNIYNIPYVAYIQEHIPKEAQGRAFSLMGSLMSVTLPIGLIVAGPVAENFGVPLWFLIGGTGMIIVTLFSEAVTLLKKENRSNDQN